MRDKLEYIIRERMTDVWFVAGKDGIEGFIQEATDQILALITDEIQKILKQLQGGD